MSNKEVIHFVGMGGIGMSGVAQIYLSLGYAVQGSDIRRNKLLEALERQGARVFVGHDAAHVEGAGQVVYSSSIAPGHPEMEAAKRKRLRILHRAEALAFLCEGKTTVAVTGTHGKTTTTAMITTILKEASRDPTFVLGGVMNAFGGNASLGKGREIVIEADESDASFLKFNPDVEVITNIEEEHLDHYQNLERIQAAYEDFVRRLAPGGQWIGCAEDPRVRALYKKNPQQALLYGYSGEGVSLAAREPDECVGGERGAAFDAWLNGERLGRVRLRVIGRHNILNALAAVAAGLRLGIDFSVIQRALAGYEGTQRRFEIKFRNAQYLVVDDYAHHPTEIQTTLEAARRLNHRRVVAVFQPHRFTRTRDFMQSFARSFRAADQLVITDIYSAGETPLPGVTAEALCETLRKQTAREVLYVDRWELLAALRDEMKPGDLVITLAAGDIHHVAQDLAEVLRTEERNFSLLAKTDTQIFNGIQGKLRTEEPLAKHTTLKVGGAARYWIEPADVEDLKKVFKLCRQHRLKHVVFGAGSNLLIPDEGWDGAVIHLSSDYFREMSVTAKGIRARAGVQNTLFIQRALQSGFGGCEFLTGIPGCIGGAIAMNAGSHAQSIDGILESVRLLDPDGKDRVYRRKQITFDYRKAQLNGGIVLEGRFKLPRRPRDQAQKKLEEYRLHRMRTQDLQHPSAGCMFKNPVSGGRSSGQLIEAAGLKGKKIGRAMISDKHANFIVNLGGASARDVLALIEEAKRAVKEAFQTELQTEVRILTRDERAREGHFV